MEKFLRIDKVINPDGPVAFFERDHWIDFSNHGNEFCLDEESLKNRISNMEKRGADVSEELHALGLIREATP